MNIAFPAIVLVLLLLPGILFRSTFGGTISKDVVIPKSFSPFSKNMVKIIIYSLFLHLVWVILSNITIGNFLDVYVNLESILVFLSGSYSNSHYSDALRSVVDYPIYVFSYFISLYILSYIFGLYVHYKIRKHKLDRRFSWLRFSNRWHYLLYGEICEFPDTSNLNKPINATAISVVTEIGGKAYLYIGILVEYDLDTYGNIERLVLEYTIRRSLDDDDLDSKRNCEQDKDYWDDDSYYEIDGHYFVVKGKDIKNINIKYLYIEKK